MRVQDRQCFSLSVFVRNIYLEPLIGLSETWRAALTANEFVKIVIAGATVAGAIGTIVSGLFAWRFREDIARAEKVKAIIKLKAAQHSRVAPGSKHEEHAMAEIGHS
jgi:hypothetical protein